MDIGIVIYAIATVTALIAHFIAWLIYFKVRNLVVRAEDCDANLKAAIKLTECSQIINSVIELSAERLKIDPDLNDFERNSASIMLPDATFQYGSEVMVRKNKPAPGPAPTGGTGEQPPKSKSGSRKSKKKAASAEKKENEKEDKKPDKSIEKGGDNFKKPKDDSAKAKAKDPNYQTLVGLGADVFGEDKKKEKFKAPEKVEKADAKDPQYETLAGIDNNLFNEEEKKNNKDKEKKEFKEPNKVKKADAKDPQYETLADVKDDIFKATK